MKNCALAIVILGVVQVKDKPCGNYSLQCSSDQKTKTSVLVSSSTLPTAIITIIVILAVICFVICLCCFISFHQQNQQRLRVSPRTPIIQRRVYSYQQGSSPNVRIRSDYDRNALSTYSRTTNIYEEPPPSYDVAVADFSPKYQSTSSSSPPPVTTSVEPTN
ncbi:unnamed protein product [Rotaria sp. Silwood2]|nr:unnamed protein product [Rotaria sp. Silwood2]